MDSEKERNMPDKRPVRGTKGGVSGAVLAGVLLVPATAIAAVAIVGATSRPPAAEAADAAPTSTTTTAVEETTSTVLEAADDGLSDEDAIHEACTNGALELIDKEIDESLTDIEAAALDALRAICAEHDLEIADPPAPEDVVKVVRVQERSTTTSTTEPTEEVASDHDGDDDHDYDDDHDDDEDHEDHEDEEDEEDDEDEEDEKDDD